MAKLKKLNNLHRVYDKDKYTYYICKLRIVVEVMYRLFTVEGEGSIEGVSWSPSVPVTRIL